jgi:hypothetical protein
MVRNGIIGIIPHGQFKGELAELALGLLCGSERAALLEHVGSCTSCSAELRDLETAVEALLLCAAEVDPPIGFEQCVLDRIQAR